MHHFRMKRMQIREIMCHQTSLQSLSHSRDARCILPVTEVFNKDNICY